MLPLNKCCLTWFPRAATALLLAVCTLALSGCPGSNYSNPSLASPGASQPTSTPPVTAPAPPPQATITPPAAAPPPSNESSIAAPPATALPQAVDGTLTTTAGAAKNGTLVGTGSGALTYAIIVPSLNGSAKLANLASGSFTYAPNPNFSGSDRLQFTVTDSVGTSSPATVTITVNPLSIAIGALSAPANIGVNVEAVSYYDTSQQYVDVVRMAGEWISTSSDTVNGPTQSLVKVGKLDANGWPTEDAGMMMVSGGLASGSAANPGPDSNLMGKYQLSFSGIARLSNNGGTIENQQYDAVTNTTTATVLTNPLGTNGTSAQVRLFFTQSQRTAASPINTGVTNVHVIRPQFAPNGTKWWDSPTQEFTNPFLGSLAPFSTLRFMQWTGNIGSQEANWDERKPPNWPGRYYIQTNGAWEWNSTTHKMELTDNWWSLSGQSWESVIDLGNVTGKDIWISIPVRATDDYVKSLATLLKQKLKPGIKVYVEYSNEIWNYGYEEFYYVDADTKTLLAGSPQAAANYQKNCISWANIACRSAERLMQISNDFASVWGKAAINDTVRPVFCWQTGSSAMTTAMAYIKQTYGAPANYFYGVCSAPYWKPSTVTAGESVDDLLAASAASIPNRDGSVLVYTMTAQYYGLHNLAYEGGPGMDDMTQIDTPNMTAANLDPRMGQQVTDALTGAFQNGLDMFVYFQSAGGSSKYGMWGATTDVFDLTQPKWQALKALRGKTITRTLAVADPTKGPRPGTTLPGTIDAGKPTFGVINSTLRAGAVTSAGFCLAAANSLPDMCMLHGDKPGGNTQYGYVVVVPKAGSYTVQLKLDSRNSIPASTAQFYVNQQPQGGSVAISAAAHGAATNPAAFTLTLPAGISLLELEATSGYFGVNSIIVTAGN